MTRDCFQINSIFLNSIKLLKYLNHIIKNNPTIELKKKNLNNISENKNVDYKLKCHLKK